MANKVSLKEAKEQFTNLLSSVSSTDKKHFITFLFQEISSNGGDCEDFVEIDSNGSEKDCGDFLLDDPIATLNTIANDIKQRVPLSAILPSEEIIIPKSGDNSDCLPEFTEHVDEFLYNEDDVDEIVEEGKLQRNYCRDCGSKNVEPLIFISHSMSRDTLYHVFNNCLPTLENKVVLDIGSRLGAVLYGAYVFTDAPRIIGVEMNPDFCKLQNDIVQKYKMSDRIEVVNKRIEDCEDLVKLADVLVFNNALEFYVPDEVAVMIWRFLKKHAKPGALLVTRPHLKTIFKNLNSGSLVEEDWVEACEVEVEACDHEGDSHDIGVYRVRG